MSIPRNLGELRRVSARLLSPSTHRKSALESIRVQCPLSARDRTGAECSQCDRFIGWGVSTAGELLLACRLPCACWKTTDQAAVEASEAVFCNECRERASASTDDCELGAGG